MTTLSTEHVRRHRQRLREQGRKEILLSLPAEAVEVLDRLRAVQGAPNRGAVVLSLIRQVTEGRNALTTA